MRHHQALHEHQEHHPLHLKPHDIHAQILGPRHEAWQVKLTDPALAIMTDFQDRAFFTVDGDEPIEEALDRMKHAGLRAAFVLDRRTEKLLGMVTAYDIMGEKPLRFLQGSGFASQGDIKVADIMEDVKDMALVELHDVQKATVQAVLDTLEKCRCTHLPVVETVNGDEIRLRGLFSTAKVLRLTEEARKAAPGN